MKVVKAISFLIFTIATFALGALTGKKHTSVAVTIKHRTLSCVGFNSINVADGIQLDSFFFSRKNRMLMTEVDANANDSTTIN